MMPRCAPSRTPATVEGPRAEDGRAACACRYEDDGWDAYKAEKIAARKSDGGSMTIDDAKFAEARTQLDQAVRLLSPLSQLADALPSRFRAAFAGPWRWSQPRATEF